MSENSEKRPISVSVQDHVFKPKDSVWYDISQKTAENVHNWENENSFFCHFCMKNYSKDRSITKIAIDYFSVDLLIIQ